MKKLTKYFLRGLLVFVPAALTIFVIVWAFRQLDSIFGKIFKLPIPGMGFVLTILTILLLGFLASNFLGKKIFSLIDKIFSKVPIIKLLYSAIKDLIEAFAGDKKSFDKPAIVELIPDGPKVMGFITNESLEKFGLDDYVSVYLPQSYNFAGNVLLFRKEMVEPLDIDSSTAMTFIVSGGVAGK